MREAKYWDAAFVFHDCAKKSGDPNLSRLVADAEISAYKQVIDDPKALKEKKDNAMAMLVQDYPEQGKLYEAIVKRNDQELARLRKAERKRHGVSIGMSQEEVLESSWGRPTSVNTTIGTYGRHEQWVYGGSNYLYFENGLLTTIQK